MIKAKKGEMENWHYILTVVAIIALVMLIVLSVRYNVLTGYGHGKYSSSVISTLLRNVGIGSPVDYYEPETGDSFCFESDCWEMLDDNYAGCMSGTTDGADCEFMYRDRLFTECVESCETES